MAAQRGQVHQHDADNRREDHAKHRQEVDEAVENAQHRQRSAQNPDHQRGVGVLQLLPVMPSTALTMPSEEEYRLRSLTRRVENTTTSKPAPPAACDYDGDYIRGAQGFGDQDRQAVYHELAGDDGEA